MSSGISSRMEERSGGSDDMSDGECSPPPQRPTGGDLEPPLLQILDEDSLDIVMNPLTSEAALSGISRRAAHKRFQVLGQDLIRYAALRYLWDKYPMDTGVALLTKRDGFCRQSQLATFAQLYKLTTHMEALEFNPNDIDKVYASTFEAYVGAATTEMSVDRAYDWVYKVCKNYGEEATARNLGSTVTTSPMNPNVHHQPMNSNVAYSPTTHVQMGYNFEQPNNNYGPTSRQPPSHQPVQSPVKQELQEYHPSMPLLPPPGPPVGPPIGQYAPSSGPSYYARPGFQGAPIFQATASKVSGSLAALRQKASQMRKEVSFTETHIGPDHQRQWTCALLVDHIEMGIGTASSKQIAKDLAAQQALLRLGWIGQSS
ncbi:hypothetical protein CALVIDRAFT_601263 [Calocera viscosa TUFC12733]|uniref:DRBM domain-containing protein n=1 Tax=Calocera viscosa (strain TUFC12733) TaxID=1330018 RepID=A0A167INL3_CALVF|nr:hypothetical protein CALVIDRAFT_601263 [Calocera viscosa TUFC12733]